MLNDVRYALRTLAQRPGFTTVAVLTLALGIGATTAIFSVVDAVLLRPLPFAEPERLVWLGGWSGNDQEQGVTPADFLDYRDQSQSFAQLAASISETVPVNLTGSGEPERLHGALVTANYLDVFRVRPERGRIFLDGEDEAGRDRVVVLSHGLWVRRFGADPSVINKPVTLDGRNVLVIGVMPPQFRYPLGAELWQPFGFPASPQSPFRSRQFHMLRPVARLKPSVTLAQAQAQAEIIARRLQALYPTTNAKQSLFLMPLQERVVGRIRLTLLILLGAVGCILLIACANVANLLLVRAASRHKEIALRAALGASRGRVVRQLLTESVTLALLGGIGGVLFATLAVRGLSALGSSSVPRADEIGIDVGVLAVTLGVALVTGVLFGLAPAWQSARFELTEAIKEGARGAGGGVQRHRTMSLLVVGEVSLAVVLLIAAGLLVNSFVRLEQVSPGFDATHLLTARIDLPNPYADPAKKANFFEQLQERVAALPGVEAVGLVTELPLANQSADVRFTIEGRPPTDPGHSPSADIRNVNHNYLRALRIPLLRGRSFTGGDVRENGKVVLISELLAKRYFAGEDPLGQRLRPASWTQSYEIVGVVGDVRHRGLDVEPRQTMYFPSLSLGYANLVIRTATDPVRLASAVRKAVAAIDPNQPISDVKTMEDWAADSVAQPRDRTLLLSMFATVALLLSVVGIYGVMSYAVTQRTREIGVRVALGAARRDVLRLVVGQGLALALAGVFVGGLVGLATTRALSSLLYGVSPLDPLTFIGTALLLAAVAVMSSYLPARRAMRVDPMAALRYE